MTHINEAGKRIEDKQENVMWEKNINQLKL